MRWSVAPLSDLFAVCCKKRNSIQRGEGSFKIVEPLLVSMSRGGVPVLYYVDVVGTDIDISTVLLAA